MKIGIIGAGFTGLAAAHTLSKSGHNVTIFEKDAHPGGLAVGYKEKAWEWSLEKHYHHWFTNDKNVLALAEEIEQQVIIKRPKTSSYVDGNTYRLDSPSSLLQFSGLPLADRIRMGTSLAALRYNPFWKVLERFRAEPYLKTTMGIKAYKTLWEALMVHKMGEYAPEISLAWFWARVRKRTASLAYPAGGFLSFAHVLVQSIQSNGGKTQFNSEIQSLTENKNEVRVSIKKSHGEKSYAFDKVLVTLPSFLFLKIAPQLPASYKLFLTRLKSIGAINMVLRLKKPFLEDNTYWLNICDITFPILAIVEHTNFMDKKHYNNEHLVYVGNYLPLEHPFFHATNRSLFQIYNPHLKIINASYEKNLIDYTVFKAPFAQPIITRNYSKRIPSFRTPLPNVFLANIEQVYPWDRGTNYAVELGEKVAKLIHNSE